MHPVGVYGPRLTPWPIFQQFDAKYLYDREYEVETQLPNRRWLYRYRKITKRRL